MIAKDSTLKERSPGGMRAQTQSDYPGHADMAPHGPAFHTHEEGRIRMPVLLMAAWLLFNGKVTLELVLVGVVLVAAVYGGCCVLLGFSWKKELRLWKKLPRVLAYLALLVWEVLLANLQVIRLILSPNRKEHTRHRLIWFPAPVKSGVGQVILANSITLTPGTITVSTPEGRFCVHALDEQFAHGLDQSRFVKAIRAMEEDTHD